MSAEDNAELIEVERLCWNETMNPMHAWAAFALARVVSQPVPAWVLAYLDSVARGVLNISHESSIKGAKDAGPRLAKVMGFATSGRGSGFSNYHEPWMAHGMNVRHRMQLGDQQDHAIDYVAQNSGASYSTVERAWKRYDRLFPGDAVFPDEVV